MFAGHYLDIIGAKSVHLWLFAGHELLHGGPRYSHRPALFLAYFIKNKSCLAGVNCNLVCYSVKDLDFKLLFYPWKIWIHSSAVTFPISTFSPFVSSLTLPLFPPETSFPFFYFWLNQGWKENIGCSSLLQPNWWWNPPICMPDLLLCRAR